MLTLAPGCSPRRLRPAVAAIQLPSRTVAQGPTCGAQIAPIGALTSQLFANVYLDALDHHVKDNLGAKMVALFRI